MTVQKYKPTNWVEFLEQRNKTIKSKYDNVLDTFANSAKLMSCMFDISGADIYVSKDYIVIEFIFDSTFLVINKVHVSKCTDEDTIWKLVLKTAVKNQRMYDEFKCKNLEQI